MTQEEEKGRKLARQECFDYLRRNAKSVRTTMKLIKRMTLGAYGMMDIVDETNVNAIIAICNELMMEDDK